jgi:hypothetical protein
MFGSRLSPRLADHPVTVSDLIHHARLAIGAMRRLHGIGDRPPTPFSQCEQRGPNGVR